MPKAKTNQKGLLDSWGRRNRYLEDRACPNCGNLFRPLRNSSRYCSRPCAWSNNGGKNRKPETWWINGKGYIEGKIWLDEHTQIRVKKHRWIMEQRLGRKLLPEEDVHHVNGDKTDNRLENLQVMTHVEHSIQTNHRRWNKAEGK